MFTIFFYKYCLVVCAGPLTGNDLLQPVRHGVQQTPQVLWVRQSCHPEPLDLHFELLQISGVAHSELNLHPLPQVFLSFEGNLQCWCFRRECGRRGPVLLLVWRAKQKVFVLHQRNSACSSLRHTKTQRKRLDVAVIDMGDTIITNAPVMFYDAYCTGADIHYVYKDNTGYNYTILNSVHMACWSYRKSLSDSPLCVVGWLQTFFGFRF